MTDRVKNLALAAAVTVAAALGAAALAGAASNGGSATSSQPAASQSQAAANGAPRQRPDETLLTGETASKVRAAALAAVSGGTIDRVETDADGHAKYEAHMTKADGSRVTAYVNAQFEVVSVESGP
jgi:uncharacterized membrane protein YkoI